MRRLVYSLLCTACFFTVIFLSCKKSDIERSAVDETVVFPTPAATPVNGSVTGRIVDQNDQPIASATIECAGISTSTDAAGFFNVNNAVLDKYITTVIVTKAGYFKGYRSFSATAGRNYVHIKLITKTLSAAISSNSASTVTLSNSTEIKFQANSIVVKSTGAAYNGTVNVYAHYIDPTADDISSIIPGSLMGRDNNNLYALKSTGMIAVDIESTTGEALQLAAGLPATIQLPIPASLTGSAPSTIDTWSLDEQGVWKKEGSAVKSGNYYSMQVTHFSFWNCDYPCNAVYLELHVQDASGHALPHLLIQLTASNVPGQLPATASGITDSSGNVAGMVPAGVTFALNTLNIPNINPCLVYPAVQNIGPFNTNSALTVTIPPSSILPNQQLTITGTANDCLGQPLNGQAFIYSGAYYQLVTVTNGNYSTTIDHCLPVSEVYIHISDATTTGYIVGGPYAVSGNAVTVPLLMPPCGVALNIYDGRYAVMGTYSDVSPAGVGFSALYPKVYLLETTGPTSVTVVDSSLGTVGYVFSNAGSPTYYGTFGLCVSFNANSIAEVHNYWGDPNNPPLGSQTTAAGSGPPLYSAGNTRRAVLDPSGINSFDPVTRTIKIKYLMIQPNQPTGDNPRAYFDETWTYLGPR